MSLPTILYQSRIYRADLRANRNFIYIFGDNAQRIGLGGQAKEMRGEYNAHGIATLEAPGFFWTDDKYNYNRAIIDHDILTLLMRDPRIIVFPLDGIGTGLARLKETAPETFSYLNTTLKKIGIQNVHAYTSV